MQSSGSPRLHINCAVFLRSAVLFLGPAYVQACRHAAISCSLALPSLERLLWSVLCSAAAAIADASKHALVKDAWEFLHDEGHINQGVLEGEPPRTTACEFYLYLHCTCTC